MVTSRRFEEYSMEHSGQTSAHVRALEWRKGGQNGGASLWAEVVTLNSVWKVFLLPSLVSFYRFL